MILRSVVEGGQTTAHKVRMLRQVLRITMLCGLGAAALFMGERFYRVPQDLYLGSAYIVKAKIAKKLKLSDVTIPGWVLSQVDKTKNWNSNRVYPIDKARPALKKYSEFWGSFFAQEGKTALEVSAITSIGVTLLFGCYGIVRRRTKHLKGRKIASRWRPRFSVRKYSDSHPPSIGGIQMVPGSENQHIMISGGTGSGKTNCLKEILNQLKDKKVVIVDPTNCLKENYFDKDRGDIILNPLDPEGAYWNPWEECQNDEEICCFGEALIPVSQSPEAEFWRSGSRTIAVELLKHFRSSGSLPDLCHAIMNSGIQDIAELLSDTPASRFVDPAGDRTAASMLMEATRWVKCLKLLKKEGELFRIGEWIRNNNSGWLFLSCTPTQRPQVRDVIRAWLNLATRSLMDLDVNLSRKIWFAIDELPALERVQGLETLLSEGRKYGACTALCFQSPSQLDDIYGRSSKKVIVSNCATKVAFREGDCANAKELSFCLGEQEVEEHQEGISYGAHEMRDGVSISTRKTTRPCVSPDDLMRLSPNQGFLSLPNNEPIRKIKVSS